MTDNALTTDKPSLSLIVPMYNEGPGARALIETCAQTLNQTGLTWELILVNDGSTDDTEAQCLTVIANYPAIVLSHAEKLGKTAALATGFDQAQGDYIFTLDADLQENPLALVDMLNLLQGEYDMVVGWRKERKDARLKCLVSRIFNRALSGLSGLPLHDINCGFKGMTRAVMETLRPLLIRDFHRFLPTLAHMRKFHVTEWVVEHAPRQHGTSRYGFERYIKAVADLLLLLPWMKRGHAIAFFLLPALGTGLLIAGLPGFGVPLLAIHALYLGVWLWWWNTKRPTTQSEPETY